VAMKTLHGADRYFEGVSRIVKEACKGEMKWRPQGDVNRTAEEFAEALLAA
jgi:hypothetical protein